MLAHYGPSKAAVIEMSHSVARIGATRGLRSNTVMPGLILTDMCCEPSRNCVGAMLH